MERIFYGILILFAVVVIFILSGGPDSGNSPPVLPMGTVTLYERSGIALAVPEEWGTDFIVEEHSDNTIAVYHMATRELLPQGGWLFTVRRYEGRPGPYERINTGSIGVIQADGSTVYYLFDRPDGDTDQYLPNTEQGARYLEMVNHVSDIMANNSAQ